MPADGLAGFESSGDPDAPFTPSQKDVRRQADAEQSARTVLHSHAVLRGEGGGHVSHSHDADEPGHGHAPERVFPLRADGGYVQELGAAAAGFPPLSPERAQRIAAVLSRLLANPTPDHMLMRWRLRLFCGHVIERTAHVEHTTAGSAFGGSVHGCPECDQDPVVIVAARPLGLKGRPPNTSRPPLLPTSGLKDRLRRAEAEVERLRKELADEERRQ